MADVEITETLVVSTGHLSEMTCNVWLFSCPWACYEKSNGFTSDVGWFLWIPADGYTDETPEELKKIIDFATTLDCQWIMFDEAGPHLDGFEKFDW